MKNPMLSHGAMHYRPYLPICTIRAYKSSATLAYNDFIFSTTKNRAKSEVSNFLVHA